MVVVSRMRRSMAPSAAARRRAATRRSPPRALLGALRLGALRLGAALGAARDRARSVASPAARERLALAATFGGAAGVAGAAARDGAAPLRRPALGGPATLGRASGSSHSGVCRPSSARGSARGHTRALPKAGDERREVLAALLEVPVVVEARAGRAEQHDVARHGDRGGVRDGRLEVGQDHVGRRPLPHRGAPPLEGLAQRRGRGADQDGLLDAPLGGLGQGVERGALQRAAEDQVDRAGVGGEGLEGGVDVGRLGVVHPGHAGDDADDLQAVHDPGEAAQGGGDVGRRHAERRGRRRGGQRVGHVVLALEGELVDRAELARGRRAAQPQHAVGHPGQRRRGLGVDTAPQLHATRGQREGAAARPPGQARRGRASRAGVVGVQQREVGRRLVFEHAQLGFDVPAEAAVPVDVVFGQVQQHGHVGPEADDVLELKARELGDHHGSGVDRRRAGWPAPGPRCPPLRPAGRRRAGSDR